MRVGRIVACGMCICVDGGVGIIERDGRIMACGMYIIMCGWGCRYH